MAPALSLRLVIGALYAFFSMAPAILLDGFKLSSLAFGLLFASTVFVFFAAGLLAPRAAKRWGQVFLAGALGRRRLAARVMQLSVAVDQAMVPIQAFEFHTGRR